MANAMIDLGNYGNHIYVELGQVGLYKKLFSDSWSDKRIGERYT